MPMLIILGSLVGGFISPSPELVTLPSSLQILSGLVTAAPMSLFMGRFGRRAGFSLGAGTLLLGSLCGAYSILQSDFALLCFAHILMGSSLACFGFFRFAAAEAAPDNWQASAISFTLAGGLLAAMVGPAIFDATEKAVFPVPFVSSYLAMSVIALAGTIPLMLITPGKVPPKQNASGHKVPIITVLRRPPIMLAMVTGIVAQSAMVLVMTPTPLAMVGHGLDTRDASEVIRWHVIGMFAPSLFTGALINRFGVLRITALGMFFLLVSAAIAMSDVQMINFFVSLLLLGMGWNFGFVGATYLLSRATAETERGYVQGINDTAISLGSTVSAFLSGAMLTSHGWVAVPFLTVPFVLTGFVALAVFGRSSSETGH